MKPYPCMGAASTHPRARQRRALYVITFHLQTHPAAGSLGVTVDPDALKRCKQRYERDGVISQLGVTGETYYRQFLQQ